MWNCSCPALYLIYTSHFQDRVLKYTAIWNNTMFSQADNHMKEWCFQSASLCGKYPYIGDLYLQFFLYCFIFYEILRLPFWLKSSLMLHFLAFHWQRRFCVNEYIAKIYMKIICKFFSGRVDVHLQVIQPILKFPYLITPIKHRKIRHLK